MKAKRTRKTVVENPSNRKVPATKLGGDDWELQELGTLLAERKTKIVPVRGDSRPYVALEHMAQGEPVLLGHGRADDATSAKSKFETATSSLVSFARISANVSACPFPVFARQTC
jgi:hypothetical protein